jgi:hypothetical protein
MSLRPPTHSSAVLSRRFLELPSVFSRFAIAFPSKFAGLSQASCSGVESYLRAT